MLDQDLIRLQQKVDVVLEYRTRQEILQDAEEKEVPAEKEEVPKKEKMNKITGRILGIGVMLAFF